MNILKLSVAKTCPLNNDGDINIDWDLDRWENDGGRNIDKTSPQS